MTVNPLILDYARSQPRWPRRIIRTLAAALLLIPVLLVWHWRIDIANRFTAYRLQTMCLNCALPSDTVIFEPDPARAALLKRDHPHDYDGPSMVSMRLPPIAWFDLSVKLLPSHCDFYVIFLHERIARGVGGGQARLVAIVPGSIFVPVSHAGSTSGGASLFTELNRYCPALEARVLHEGTPIRYPQELRSSMIPWEKGVTRIYAGQADPADNSHFTFDYEAYGQRDTVDGWLEADDTVTMKARKPPTAPLP